MIASDALKTCIMCGKSLPTGEFYRHEAMADGHLNKCKQCCRSCAITNRRAKVDYYREYDRARMTTARRKESLARRQRRYREANPVKAAARAAVNRAVMSGALRKMPCEVCGCHEVDGHHDDYAKPLSVRWLCRKHHLELHAMKCAQSN